MNRKLIGSLLAMPLALLPAIADDSTPSSMPIVGRIEKTGPADSTLPMDLIKLQAAVPTLDPIETKTLKAGVETVRSEEDSSFPAYIAGRWGGQLTITSEFHKGAIPVDPARAEGTPGLVIFTFSDDGKAITVKPTKIFMPHMRKRLADCYFAPGDLERFKQRLQARGEQLEPNMIVERDPEITFGTKHAFKTDGSELQVKITADSLKQLQDGVIEQDIVTSIENTNAAGRTSLSYEESILQFRKTGEDTEYVRAAKITYGPDRAMRRRIVIEGPLNRNWAPYAEKISVQLKRPWQTIEHNLDL